VYRCAIAGSSTLSPEQDPQRWKDMRPTNLWAPFDEYTDTAAQATTDITYVLASRFVNALALYGLVGAGVSVSIKDAPGGAEIYRFPEVGYYQLKRPARGYYDYAYGDRKARTTLVLRDLPIRANAEITITVHGAEAQSRAVGMIVRGKFRSLHGAGDGGVLEDAEVTPKTFTYREQLPDGKYRITVRGSSKDLSFQVVMERQYADQAVQALQDLQSRPVAWFVSAQPGFDGLTAFGFVLQSPVRYRNRYAYIDARIQGNV